MAPVEEILTWSPRHALLVPVKWRPWRGVRRNYIAVLIGLNARFDLERVFLEPSTCEVEGNLLDGFKKDGFHDGMIIEERFTFKEDHAIVSKLLYFRIVVTENGVSGEKLSREEATDAVALLQESIYSDIRGLMSRYGDEITLSSMQAILRERERMRRRSPPSFFQP